MLFVCAMAGPAPPAVEEARSRFLFCQRQKAMAAAAINTARPPPMPMPALAGVESPEDITERVGVETGELGIVVVGVVVGVFLLLRDE